jgi:phosphoribosylformylglycinamidine cyclo-ligase
MAHITGGGFYDNIPRALPAQVSASISFDSWDIPTVFRWLKEQGKLSWPEMLQIFNCGIGYIIIVPPESAGEVIHRINALQFSAWEIGSIVHAKSSDEEQVQMHFPT